MPSSPPPSYMTGHAIGPSNCHCIHRVTLVVDRGTLLTRNLADVVSKYDFISDSKHLVTLLVVVPRQV